MNDKIKNHDLLRKTIFHAVGKFSFYKWFYNNLKNFYDYYNLPYLKKEDILEYNKSINTSEEFDENNDSIIATTTGTTNTRLEVRYSKKDIENITNNILNALKWWGYKNGPINAVIFGHPQDFGTIMLDQIATKTDGKMIFYSDIKNNLDNILNYEIVGDTITLITSLSNLLSMMNSHSYMKMFERLKFKYILTIVTPQECQLKLHIEIKQRLGEIELIPVYGSTEMGLISIACPHTFESSFTHIIQEGLFNILNDEGKLQENGMGELIYSSLGREAFPFIKYKIGDIVSLDRSTGSFKCDHTDNVIKFVTRKPMTIKIPDGAGYFFDVLKINDIITNTILGSQIICIYGENINSYYLFLAIFIIHSNNMDEVMKNQIKEQIISKIILNHIDDVKVKERGLNNLVKDFEKNFPIFFIENLTELPKEVGAGKTKMLLNLMQDDTLVKKEEFKDLFVKLENYLK